MSGTSAIVGINLPDIAPEVANRSSFSEDQEAKQVVVSGFIIPRPVVALAFVLIAYYFLRFHLLED